MAAVRSFRRLIIGVVAILLVVALAWIKLKRRKAPAAVGDAHEDQRAARLGAPAEIGSSPATSDPATSAADGLRTVYWLRPSWPETAHLECTLPDERSPEAERQRCGPDVELPTTNATVDAAIIAAHIVLKVGGPHLALTLALPLWRFRSRWRHPDDPEPYVASDMWLSFLGYIEGARDDGSTETFSVATGTLLYEQKRFHEVAKHLAATLHAPLPDEFVDVAASVTSVSLTGTISSRLSADVGCPSVSDAPGTKEWQAACTARYEHTASFERVPVALPFDVTLAGLKSLVTAQRDNPAHTPELGICYGPQFSPGRAPPEYFRYMRELIARNLEQGVLRMVFYIGAQFLSPELANDFDDLRNKYAAHGDRIVWVLTRDLDERIETFYHNQRLLISHCLQWMSGPFRFVFIGDIDEQFWIADGGPIAPHLSVLWEARRPDDVAFTFATSAGLVQVPAVCDRVGAEDTLEQATERFKNSSLSLLEQHPYVECNFRSQPLPTNRKFIALSGYTRVVYGTRIVGSFNGIGITYQTHGRLWYMHMRDLPYKDPVCKVWSDDWRSSNYSASDRKGVAVEMIKLRLPFENFAELSELTKP